VVIVVLLALGLIFCCVRRRRRREKNIEFVSEKPQSPKKKWSRHLRVFSFDAELLMGGWRSSSNSVRSRQTGSVRSGQGSHRRTSPSIHSVDDVAPPYRDAITTTHRPHHHGVTSPSPDPFPRPSSTATAPPPYVPARGNISRQSNLTDNQNRPVTPPSRDPFADRSPISPIETSPFNDPADDGGSTLAGSDAGSIREAQVARSLSVMSGGRTIENTRGSQRSTRSRP
jgi:hypothetical protein